MNDATRERVAQYYDRHPEATDAEVCGRFDLAPGELTSIDLRESSNSGDTSKESPEEHRTGRSNPRRETEGSGSPECDRCGRPGETHRFDEHQRELCITCADAVREQGVTVWKVVDRTEGVAK